MNWEKVKLNEVCEVIAGQSPPSSTYNYIENGLPFFQGKTDFGDVYPKVRMWCSEPNKIAQPLDVLLSVRAPVGPTNICNIKSCIGRGLAAIRSNGKTDPKFVYYFFQFIEPILSTKGNGSTFSAITIGDVKELDFPLPPLPIQQKIAAILDQADALRKKDRLLLAKYDELLQAVFYDMFGDPVKNEKGWEKDIVINYCDCIVPGRDKPKSFSGNIPWVTTDDLEHLGVTTFSKRNIGLTRSEIDEVRGRIIPKNSVIMTCVGDLGIISIAGTEMVVNQQLHAFQTKEKLNNFFLMYMLSKRKDYMLRMATSTTVPYMNKTICNSIPILLPPLSLQTHFAHMYQNIIGQKSKLKHQIEQSENLFQCLLQQAFKGGGW